MSPFLQGVRDAMVATFGSDTRRIAHAEAVADYARQILAFVEADAEVVLAAAYLHDIGIAVAERRFGRCTAAQQEELGPPLARQILHDLVASEALVDPICEIIGHHHTPQGVDSPEFRVLWDADALVNFAETLQGQDPETIESRLHRHMVTEAGYRLAQKIYLPSRSSR